MSALEYTLHCGIYSALLLLLLLLLLFSFLPEDWMFRDCGRRGLYIWKASDLTPEVTSPGQLKVHVCFQQQLCKLLLPRSCRAYVKIPQRQCPLCEPIALLIPGNSNPSFKRNGPKMALPPQTDVFQPLSKAAFISSWKGKHHNLGSHVSCLSVRHCQLFLQHPRVLWQSREQVTHLSKGYSERYHSEKLWVPSFGFVSDFFFSFWAGLK